QRRVVETDRLAQTWTSREELADFSEECRSHHDLESARPLSHDSMMRWDAPRWIAADTNTFASMTTSTVEATGQLVARRRRTARTSSTASSSASSSSSVGLASTLEARASRV